MLSYNLHTSLIMSSTSVNVQIISVPFKFLHFELRLHYRSNKPILLSVCILQQCSHTIGKHSPENCLEISRLVPTFFYYCTIVKSLRKSRSHGSDRAFPRICLAVKLNDELTFSLEISAFIKISFDYDSRNEKFAYLSKRMC